MNAHVSPAPEAFNASSRVGLRSSRLAVATLALIVVGAALRICGARGALWFDEIWTLKLVAPAQSAADILLRTRYDNNHFLNSLWMWGVGVDSSPLTLRLQAIAFGVLAIPAAALACRRHSALAATVAAGVVAVGYFFVHYGSEARGYSGMILAILAGKAALDRIAEEPVDPRAFALFAAAVFFGMFAHVTMLEAVAALALAGLGDALMAGRPRRGVAIVAVASLAAAPGLGLFLWGFLNPDFHVGVGPPFTFDQFFQGLAGVTRTTLGLPPWLGDRLCVALTALGVLGALYILPPQRRWFPIAAIFVLPLLHAVAGLPNQFYPRFHLTTAVALALVASEAAAELWARHSAARLGVAVGAVAFLVAQATMLTHFFETGRGDYAGAARLMTAEGATTFTAETYKGETKLIVDYVARREHLSLSYVQLAEDCATHARWLIDVTMSFDAKALSERRRVAGRDCASVYDRVAVFPAWGLSGMNWWLYRRADPPAKPAG